MKSTIAAALVGLGVATALVSAPTSQASNSQYLAALAADGISSPGGIPVLLDWGYRVCADKNAGASMAYSASNIDMQTSLDYAGAMDLVMDALAHLC